MKARRLVLAMVGSLVLSGAALAQGGMGKGMGMGMMGGGDGKVTKEQFLKHAEERFGRMDTNKDGVIDATDRKAMRERMRECREMMGGMGMMGGGDEKATKEQFLKRAEERFGRMDTNKDGVIDATDRKAMRERMRECREMMGGMHMMGDKEDKAGKPAAEHHPAQ